MKIRALRREASDGAAPDESRLPATSWIELRNLFVREAEPQVEVIVSSLKSLMSAENIGHELAYLMRATQSVRLAAESVRVADIAALAWALEAAIAACKGQSSNVLKVHVATLRAAAEHLSAKIAALTSAETERTLAGLQALTEAMQAVPITADRKRRAKPA
jgi:chemotaxis protein histidine kinase CheA